jgi:hypothetical protein
MHVASYLKAPFETWLEPCDTRSFRAHWASRLSRPNALRFPSSHAGEAPPVGMESGFCIRIRRRMRSRKILSAQRRLRWFLDSGDAQCDQDVGISFGFVNLGSQDLLIHFSIGNLLVRSGRISIGPRPFFVSCKWSLSLRRVAGLLSVGNRNIESLQFLPHPHGKFSVDVEADVRPQANEFNQILVPQDRRFDAS